MNPDFKLEEDDESKKFNSTGKKGHTEVKMRDTMGETDAERDVSGFRGGGMNDHMEEEASGGMEEGEENRPAFETTEAQ
jgi:hypothetical protein